MNKSKLTSDDFPYCSFSPNQHMEKVPEKTVACWSDLLGFRSSLDAIDWNLENDESKILLRRLLHFQHQVKSRFMPNEEGLFINDAIIRTFNKSIYNEKMGSRHDLVSWLSHCLITHCLICIEHSKLKYQLIEVKSFSPHDEHALFWFDTLNGGGHGFVVDGGMITDLDGQPVGKYLSTDDAPPELLSEYIKNFTDYLNKNGHKPDLAEFYS
ncbi:MAG: hypothetical protein ACXWFG_13460 [Methylobacter sp.]